MVGFSDWSAHFEASSNTSTGFAIANKEKDVYRRRPPKKFDPREQFRHTYAKPRCLNRWSRDERPLWATMVVLAWAF